MRLFNLDVTEAMNWVCRYHYEKQAEFLALRKELPSFGPEADKPLHEYINLLGHMIRGNYCWQFEGGRYFGDKGLKVLEDGWVLLQPKLAGIPGQSYKN